MTSREFCYWLQGFFELDEQGTGSDQPLTVYQIRLIAKHLAMVFKHEIDPSYPVEQQAELNKIHNKDEGALRC